MVLMLTYTVQGTYCGTPKITLKMDNYQVWKYIFDAFICNGRTYTAEVYLLVIVIVIVILTLQQEEQDRTYNTCIY